MRVAGAVLLAALIFVLALIPANACCGRYLDRPATTRGLHLGEWHHGYGGVLVLVPWPPAQVVGLVLIADDLFGQHVWHLSARHAQLRSPLHHLARVTWYRWRE